MADTVATTDRSSTLLTATPLLRTKLFIPQARRLQGILPRPRLVEQLQTGLARQLTLISAPAGYGKTVLLTEWIPQSPRCVCWLSLDETDNDIARFLTYFIAALQMLKADFGQSLLAALQSPQPPVVESLITALVNEIMQTLDEFALVLDDYHLIEQPAIHAAVAFLLNHLPPNMHLIITSRADPTLPLARLRVRGQMTELRAADLRFTRDEATAFFHQSKKLPLSAEQIEELATRTEGWGAGLQLAALSLQGVDAAGITRFISDFTGSHHDVFDYLVEEVLQQHPKEIRRFLLHTSVLSRLCGPLCDVILSSGAEEQPRQDAPRTLASGQEVLEYLEHANLFLVPLDAQRHWYRYHHLFADFLRDRLRRESGLAQVNDLYQCASGWFEQHGLLTEAIDYAILAQDFECAARLVDQHSASIQAYGGQATLLRWLAALPDAVFERRPTLALTHAFLLAVLDQFMAAERRLDATEQALQAAPVCDVDLMGQAAAVRLVIAQLTEQSAEDTLAAGQQALALLPPHNTIWRAMAAMFLGVAYYAQAGDLAAGYQTLSAAQQTSLDAGDVAGAVNATVHLCQLLEIGGRLRESEQLSRETLQRTGEPIWQGMSPAVYVGFTLSRVLYERNDLLTARDLLVEAIQQLEAWAFKRPLVVSTVMLARVLQALEEPVRARETIERVVQIVQRNDLKQTFSHWAEYRARLALAQNDLTTAVQWSQEVEPTIHRELNPALEFTHITLAQVFVAQRRLDDALHLLGRLLPAAQAARRMGRVLEIVLLQALTANTQNQHEEALTALSQALNLAEPEGYIRTFVDLGSPMAALLRAAQARSILPTYVAKLLAAFPLDKGSGMEDAENAPLLQPPSSHPQPVAFGRATEQTRTGDPRPHRPGLDQS